MSRVKVLFLAADPVSADPHRPLDQQSPRLQIDEEIREITAMIRAAEYRDSLEFISRWAVRADDLLQALNEVRPQIVHFSGHGSSTGELILVGRDGVPRPVPRNALTQLFRTMKDDIRLVLLNACYTQAQAEAINEVVDCVIGMEREVSDHAATTFAASFYRALGFGRSVHNAVEQGRTALMLEAIPEDRTPQLRMRHGVDPAQMVLVNPPRKGQHPPAQESESRNAHVRGSAAPIGYTEWIRSMGHCIHKLKAKDTTGRSAYYFVLVEPHAEQAFLKAIEGDGTIDLEHYVRVIASSYGETPTQEVRDFLKQTYGFDV